MRIIKKFNEADKYIDNNPAFPQGWLKSALAKRKQEISQQQAGQYSDLIKSIEITKGKETELEELLTKVLNEIYKALVDRYRIKFDIKFADTREIASHLNINESIEQEKYKRKIINLVSQGESKNMMNIIHNDELKNGLIEIFGERNGNKLIDLTIKVVKAADELDINRSNNNFSASFIKGTIHGITKVSWEKRDNTNENIDDEFFEDEEDDSWEDELKNALDSEDYNKVEEIVEEQNLPTGYVKGHYDPIVVVRGDNLAILIHESIKGLYTTLAMGGIPKDKEIARKVLEVGYAIKSEAEELKWGPMVASSLRDFLNENERIDEFPNLREEFWVYVVKLPAEEFLELINGILSQTEEARIKTNTIISLVIKGVKKYLNHKKYFQEKKEWEEKNRKYEEDKRKYDEWLKSQKKEPKRTIIIEEPEELDYENMAPSELQKYIDDAMDRKDWTEVKKLSKYIKTDDN